LGVFHHLWVLLKRAIYLLNGTQGAGKSTIARLLAARFARGVALDADDLMRHVVSGLAPITPPLSAEAETQLRLRARVACKLADTYFEAGYIVAIAEILVGRLEHFRSGIKGRPLYLINLAPSLDVVKRRNETRENKNVFEPWSPILDRAMRETMSGLGIWLDTSEQSPNDTVDEILRRTQNGGGAL